MRETAQWIGELESAGEARERALADLRVILLGGLRKSLGARGGVDEAFLEDIVQEALLKILSALDTFEGRSRFTTWAMSIAVRTALSELRRKHWQDVSLEALIEQSEERGRPREFAGDDGGSAAQNLEREALVETLNRLIEKRLTEKQRLAVTAELAGMPVAEIARRLGSNANAVYKLLHDARRKLREELETEGYSIDDVESAFV